MHTGANLGETTSSRDKTAGEDYLLSCNLKLSSSQVDL